MRKRWLSVVVGGLLFAATGTPAIAGVEPSPFFTAGITQLQTELTQIGQSFTDPDVTLALSRIDSRLATFQQAPLLRLGLSKELADQGGGIMFRLSARLFDPQPEPPGLPADWAVQFVMIIDRISAILFDPQPEPPGYVALGFDVLDRLSRVLFDPQPEPPGISPDLYAPSLQVMSDVAAVLQRTYLDGLDQEKIPALTALEALSGHFVVAVADGRRERTAAQVNAMSQIAQQYATR